MQELSSCRDCLSFSCQLSDGHMHANTHACSYMCTRTCIRTSNFFTGVWLFGTGDCLLSGYCVLSKGENGLVECLTPSQLSRRLALGAKFLSVAICEINLCVVEFQAVSNGLH